jgi:Plasmid recombination enzyme
MSYAIIRVQKLKSFSGIGRHIDRVDAEGNNYAPENADENRLDLNLHWDGNGKAFSQNEWRSELSNNPLAKRVNDRIKEGYKLEKSIRKDAVKALEYILTSDGRKMAELESKPDRFKAWLTENRNFIERIHGKENIVGFSLHRDEETAHIHAVVVPLTKDGRLTMESFVGSPKILANLQNKYAAAMEKFGMKRGEAGSRARHERPDKNKSFEKTIER